MFFKHRPVVNGKKLKSAIMTGNGMKKYVPYIWIEPEDFFVRASTYVEGVYEDFNSSDNDFFVCDINNAQLYEEETVTVLLESISQARITVEIIPPMSSIIERTYSALGRLGVIVKPGYRISYTVRAGNYTSSGNIEARYSARKYIIPSPRFVDISVPQIFGSTPDLVLNDFNYNRLDSYPSYLIEILEALCNNDKTVEISAETRRQTVQTYYDSETQTTITRPMTTTSNQSGTLKNAGIKYFNGSCFEYIEDIFSLGNVVYFIGRRGASLLGVSPGIYTRYEYEPSIAGSSYPKYFAVTSMHISIER